MNFEVLSGHLPAGVIRQIPNLFRFNVTSQLRLAHFLAQCGHESLNFTVTTENLNYDAAGLRKYFKKYFPTVEMAEEYSRKPMRIGNLVYASRMGNGPPESGEGYLYRGRGYIQLTGKNNYTAFNTVVPEDVVLEPQLVATKYPLLSAAWFWDSRKLNGVADKGDTDAVVEQVTKIVNGGRNGLDDRVRRFQKLYPLLAL